MMEQYQNIRLDFNCPKTLVELTSCNSDWYCKGCSKVIKDFRGMNEQQIIATMIADSKTHCGIFDVGSIAVVPQTKWKRYLSTALLTLGLTAFYNMVFAQHKPAVKHNAGFSAKKTIIDTAQDAPIMGVFYADTEPMFPEGISRFYDYMMMRLRDVPMGDLKGAAVKFTVERNGSIINAQMVKKVNEHIDERILQTIKLLPRWKPGVKNSRPVKTDFIFTLPCELKQLN